MIRPAPGPLLSGGALAAAVAWSCAIPSAPARQAQRLFYVPPVGALQALPGNLRAVAADVLYIQGVLAIGEEQPESLAYVHDSLQAAVALDAGLVSAYVLGGVVAPRGAGEIPKGIVFLQSCAMRYPKEWRIPFWVGFNYLQLQDPQRAAAAYRSAFLLPGAPRHLRNLTTWAYEQTDQPALVLSYMEGMAETVHEPRLRRALEAKLLRWRHLALLEQAVRAFHQRTGAWPISLQELVAGGILDRLPEDPSGGRYELDARWYKYPDRVRYVAPAR